MSSKDAKKSQEEARLQQLKQEMRNSTDNMVSNAKNNVALKSQTLNEIIETINNSSQSLKGTFEGKASEAAQQSINKLKNNNENLKQKFETLLNTLKING
ncbi:ESAT-6 family protein [Staphylococcus aureus]|uniref:WXG100 family type VII secretion target n=1 Tax=Staphylococcus aureus TaxID=1280 RepID=UPI0007CA0425|nr:WXG100 family type VII secretion target [Staphylococcus aureus]SBE65237.1 ESAT-6 family protein [Staphylococcus aureus]